MNPWSDEAIVLGSRKSNESNRVVFLLTREHGRIAAAANGVRKTKSRIGARLEPMNHVEVLVKPGRGLAVVDEVRLVTVHHRLHSDLGRMSQGMAMLEAVDRITPDHDVQQRQAAEHAFGLVLKGFVGIPTAPRL